MTKYLAIAIAAASTLFVSDRSYAVVYSFAGTVSSVPSAFSSQFTVGDIVSGRFSLTPPWSTSDTVTYYDVSNFNADIGGHYPITSNGGSFVVLNDFGGTIDQVKLDIIRHGDETLSPPISGHVADYFSFNLLYDSDDLSSTELLPQFIFAEPYDRSGLRFDVDDALTVDFELYDLSAVPEPGAMHLVLAACGVLFIFRQRRRHGLRNQRPTRDT